MGFLSWEGPWTSRHFCSLPLPLPMALTLHSPVSLTIFSSAGRRTSNPSSSTYPLPTRDLTSSKASQVDITLDRFFVFLIFVLYDQWHNILTSHPRQFCIFKCFLLLWWRHLNDNFLQARWTVIICECLTNCLIPPPPAPPGSGVPTGRRRLRSRSPQWLSWPAVTRVTGGRVSIVLSVTVLFVDNGAVSGYYPGIVVHNLWSGRHGALVGLGWSVMQRILSPLSSSWMTN